MRPDRDAILKALEQVIDPEIRKPVTELDMVRDVLIDDDGAVSVTIALTVAGCPLRHSFEEQVGKAVGAVEGVTVLELALVEHPRGDRHVLHHPRQVAEAQVDELDPLRPHQLQHLVRRSLIHAGAP